ncbi:putative transposase, Ptta/En/Spm, plant [Rosa chinensis]|uniref:Putative transposase, Ptta/En/Spm, plant n=1 Tax=Rosa chinensis TaxID=74649 RepID=A0A2P6RHJ7_ROSCH|nr:putative transposase, Ptta/En/Spm, plant [Rosa chinensis]
MVVSHTGFIINGNRFQTEASEKSTQNSGVFVEGDTMCRASARDNFQKMDRVSYYGVIRDIVLLDYRQFKVPLFDCYWANIGTGVKFEDGFTLVNLHKGQHQFDRDPFIFASQAKQIFYSRESDTSNWHVVLKAPPRGFFENDSDESAYMPVDVSQLDLDVEDEECERYDNEEINSTSKQGGKKAKRQESAARAALVLGEKRNESLRISNGNSNSSPIEADIPECQATSNSEKKKIPPRGKAKLLDIAKKKRKLPIVVEFNERGQPIGENAGIFSSFIGASARELIPMTAGTWKDLSNTFKDQIWKHVTTTFVVDEFYKKHIFRRMTKLWRDNRSLVMKEVEEQAKVVGLQRAAAFLKPNNIESMDEWLALIKHRTSVGFKEKCQKFKRMRAGRTLLHRTSRKSFARLEEELREQSENPDAISRSDIWIHAYEAKKKKSSDEVVEDPEIVVCILFFMAHLLVFFSFPNQLCI